MKLTGTQFLCLIAIFIFGIGSLFVNETPKYKYLYAGIACQQTDTELIYQFQNPIDDSILAGLKEYIAYADIVGTKKLILTKRKNQTWEDVYSQIDRQVKLNYSPSFDQEFMLSGKEENR